MFHNMLSMPEKMMQNGQFHYNLLHPIHFKCNWGFLGQGKEYSKMQNKDKKLIEVLMYNHALEDLHWVYDELIVYC